LIRAREEKLKVTRSRVGKFGRANCVGLESQQQGYGRADPFSSRR